MTPDIPSLLTLYVYVSNRCNCRCQHCWIVGDRPPRPESESFLSVSHFEQAVSEALPLGLSGVKFTGGEPTLHPQLTEMLEIASARGLSVWMETNGMAVDAKMAAALTKNGCNLVSVSLDGARAETHDRIRGVTGAFERALAGIEHLRANSVRVQVIMTLMKANVGEIDNLLERCESLGVNSVKLNLLQPTLRGLELHDAGEALSVAEILQIEKRVNEQLSPRLKLDVFIHVPLAFRPLHRLMRGEGGGLCGIRSILGILADGSYALCGIGETLPDMVFGRVDADDLGDLWREHPTLKTVREGIPERFDGICGRCLMSRACLGSCVAQNYYRTGSLMGSHWFCEQASDLGYFPDTRLRV